MLSYLFNLIASYAFPNYQLKDFEGNYQNFQFQKVEFLVSIYKQISKRILDLANLLLGTKFHFLFIIILGLLLEFHYFQFFNFIKSLMKATRFLTLQYFF